MYSFNSRTLGVVVGRFVVSPAQRSSCTSRGPQFGQVTSIDMENPTFDTKLRQTG